MQFGTSAHIQQAAVLSRSTTFSLEKASDSMLELYSSLRRSQVAVPADLRSSPHQGNACPIVRPTARLAHDDRMEAAAKHT